MTCFTLPSFSSEACISAYVRIPSYTCRYEYGFIQLMILLEIAPCSVLHVASYWLIECLRCWLLHGESSGLVMAPGGGGGVHSANIEGGLCIW